MKKILLIIVIMFCMFQVVVLADSIILRPNGDGSVIELDPHPAGDHYLNVDEEVRDDLTSYNDGESPNNYIEDLYTVENPGLGGTIISVEIHVHGISYGGYVKTAIKTHATEYYGSEHLNPDWADDLNETYAKNPNTGLDWTWAEVDDLEAGAALKKTGYAVYLTQVYIVINYEPAEEEEANMIFMGTNF